MNEPQPPARNPYISRLNLEGPAFEDTPRDAFFYADPVVVQRLDLLQHLTQFSEQLLIVKGPAGSGKTTLLRRLHRQASPSWRTVVLDGCEVTDDADLLPHLATQFGLNPQGQPDSLRQQLLNRWEALQRTGQYAVLLVEDAHKLPRPMLDALLTLAGDPQTTLRHLRVVLFSEQGVETLLSPGLLEQAGKGLLHTLELSPFDEQQTAAYLSFRLAVAGYSGESPFSPTEARAIHKASGGLPARINQLAVEHLDQQGGLRPGHFATPTNEPGLPLKRLGLGLGLVVAAALVLWFQEPINRLFEPTAEIPANTRQVPLALPDEAQSHLSEAPAEAEAEAALPQTPLPAPPSPPSPASPPRPAAPAQAADPPMTPPPAQTASASRTTDYPLVSLAPEQLRPPARRRTPAGTAEAPAVTTVPQPAARPVPPPATQASPKAPPAPVSRPAPKTSPAPAASLAPAPVADRPAGLLAPHKAIEDADWLMTQNPDNYTLQLLGAGSYAAIEDYVRKHGLEGRVATYYKLRKGKDWYSLLYGIYPSGDQTRTAHAAIQNLPEAVRKTSPWVRALSAVQADIRQSRQQAAP